MKINRFLSLIAFCALAILAYAATDFREQLPVSQRPAADVVAWNAIFDQFLRKDGGAMTGAITGATGITAATGNITATAGNIVATAGSVSAGTTVTAGTGVTATTGGVTATAGNITASNGDVVISTAGKGLSMKAGSNARIGASVLVAGTVTNANTSVGANTKIFVSRSTLGGTPGHLSVVANAGSNFIINSSEAGDTSTVNWVLIETP